MSINDDSSSVDPDMVLTLIYFSTIAAVVIGTVIYFYISARIKEPETLLMERMCTQREVQFLIDNISRQLRSFKKMPILKRSMKPYYIHYTLSWVFLIALVTSTILVIVSLSIDMPQAVRISTFCYLISLNALFMTRQHLYYVRRTHLTYDAAHYLVLDTTSYDTYEMSMFNIMQIIMLALEFLQLLSFPIRDFIQSTSLAQSDKNGGSSGTVNFIISILTLFANLDSKFYIIQLWFLVSVVSLAVIVIFFIHIYNNCNRQNPIALYWVKYLLPIANLLYLPMLVMLLGSASCLSKLGTEEKESTATGILRCSDPGISKPLYLSFTISTYTIAYIILTTFVTSFDRIPIRGEIHYKSQGVAFIKNMSMLLSIDFVLIPNNYRHIRSICSLVILISMTCFNISMQPCFVEQINYWRTYGFCCILWVALIVTMLTNEDIMVVQNSIGGISAAMATGVVVLFILFVIIWRVNQTSKRRISSELDSLVDKQTGYYNPRSTQSSDTNQNISSFETVNRISTIPSPVHIR